MAKLSYIEGIGEVYEGKLREAGIRSTGDLLKKGATPEGRKALAAKSGIKPELILKWVNHADLYRIKGIGAEYGDLLEAAGVDTVPELAQRKPQNLYKKMIEVNNEKKLVRRLPTEQQVADWIAMAKTLERIVTY